MHMFSLSILLLFFLIKIISAQTIINGQIFIPGIAIVDSPQPNTPEGGDFLQVALDVSADGKVELPPYPENAATEIFNITIFLSSYITGKNFTITNGTASAGNASLGDIMLQEPKSTVKHVNWVWPDCLVGNGAPTTSSSRGAYNISIRQNFRLNGSNEYTIFNLPIEVTNSIPAESDRPSCDSLNNPLLTEAQLIASANNYTQIASTSTGGNLLSSAGVGMLDLRTSAHWIWVGTFALIFTL